MIAYLKAQEHFYAECNETRQNNHYCSATRLAGWSTWSVCRGTTPPRKRSLT